MGAAVACSTPVAAQRPVTEPEAVRAALEALPRLALARADSAAAGAALRTAAQYPNPGFALGYSQDPPHYHVELEQELDYPWVRSPRVAGARAALRAAALRLELTRARVRYDAVAAYATAAAARQSAALSARLAAAGEELVRVARARRDAGEASDLDVDLAEVGAAQLRSAWLTDSLQAVTAVLSLQALMGLPVVAVEILPVDTLPPPETVAADSALAVAVGEAEARAAERRLAGERRARLPAMALRVGFEQGNPPGEKAGLLPTFGVALPLPLFHLNGGEVAAARAEAERAVAELAEARLEAGLAVSLAARERSNAEARLTADQAALAAARRVATRSLAAYREGEYALASVLEAQRAAAEAERQVVADIAALRTARAALALARYGGVRP